MSLSPRRTASFAAVDSHTALHVVARDLLCQKGDTPAGAKTPLLVYEASVRGSSAVSASVVPSSSSTL